MYSPRTVVVSDRSFNSDCIYALLLNVDTIKLIANYYSYKEAISPSFGTSIDVILVDVDENSNLDHIRQLFKSYRSTRKLIITSSTNNWFLSSLIHMGADGCFITTSTSCALADAIRKIYTANWYLPKELYNKLYCELSSRDLKSELVNVEGDSDNTQGELNIDSLTCRELEILQLMTQGKPSSKIAKELFISKATVYTHRKHILKKLGFCSTPTLIRCAVEQGVV